MSDHTKEGAKRDAIYEYNDNLFFRPYYMPIPDDWRQESHGDFVTLERSLESLVQGATFQGIAKDLGSARKARAQAERDAQALFNGVAPVMWRRSAKEDPSDDPTSSEDQKEQPPMGAA